MAISIYELRRLVNLRGLSNLVTSLCRPVTVCGRITFILRILAIFLGLSLMTAIAPLRVVLSNEQCNGELSQCRWARRLGVSTLRGWRKRFSVMQLTL